MPNVCYHVALVYFDNKLRNMFGFSVIHVNPNSSDQIHHANMPM